MIRSAYLHRGLRTHLKPLIGIAACVLAALLLTGCDNNPFPSGETASGVLERTMLDDPKTFDPEVAYDEDVDPIIYNMYPCYLQYNYLKRDPFVLDLNLGATQPERKPYPYTDVVGGKKVAAMGETWSFRIKPGLRFQDDPCFPGGRGREITAADFVYSFRRMADPAINCPVLSYFDDKVFGMQEYEAHNTDLEKAGKKPDYTFPMAGLVLDPSDPYSFKVVLKKPYPQLRYLMAMHFTSPLAHEAVEKYGKQFAWHPVGCGPFVLTQYVPKGFIFMKANPNYHDDRYPGEGMPGDREAGLLDDAGKRLPLATAVRYSIIREGVPLWNLFQQGYLDAAGVGRTNYQQAMAGPGLLSPEITRRGIRLLRMYKIGLWYFIFNMNDPVVGGLSPQHRKLRQAISCAIDTRAFLDVLYAGIGKPAQSLVPPGLFGYDPNRQDPYRQYDIAKAKRLLTEAGYPDGIDPKTGERLTIYYDNSADSAAGRQATALLTKQFAAIGVRLESRSWRFAVYQSRMDHNQFQFTEWGWNADYPDPENFVFLLASANATTGGPNYSRYKNPAYDALFEKMRSMDDTPERRAIIQQMEDMLQEDSPLVYHYYDEVYALTQPWLHNVKLNAVALDSAKYQRVDSAMRLRLEHAWNHPNYWPLLGAALLLVLGSLPAAAVVRQRTNRYVRRLHDVNP